MPLPSPWRDATSVPPSQRRPSSSWLLLAGNIPRGAAKGQKDLPSPFWGTGACWGRISPWGLGTLFLSPCPRGFVPTAAAPSSCQPCTGAGRRSNPSPGFEPVAGEISPFPGRSRQETCTPYLTECFNCCHCPMQRQGSGRWGGWGGTLEVPPLCREKQYLQPRRKGK